MPATLMDIYQTLYDHFGPQKWWPGDSEFEIAVGAILTQNTNWTNVEKAITNLKKANCLNVEKLHHIDQEQLAQLIRPAGYFNLKSQRLKNFINWLMDNHQGSIESAKSLDVYTLRQELISIKGIGPETADSILLYALDKPVFVVDAYTCRILARHHLISPEDDYHNIQDTLQSALPGDIKLFNEFHALLVQLGKNHCKPKPKCTGCPLESLPHDIDPLGF